jgi:hypothetical protein
MLHAAEKISDLIFRRAVAQVQVYGQMIPVRVPG